MTALSNEELTAITCIPGAIFEAHAGCTSTATSRLIIPRKRIEIVPVLDASIGVAAIRDRYQKDVCHGNARTAKLLQRLIFRYLPEENGKARLRTYRYNSFWWEKSYEDWAAELDLTVKQVRTDFAKLKEWGLAEARPLKVYEGKNAGKTVTHCRVFAADGAASLSGWPDYSQLRIILGCPNGHPIAMPKWAFHSDAQMGVHKAKEEVTQKEKGKEEVNSVPTKPGTTGTPALHQAKAGKADGKLTPPPVKTKPDEPDLLPEKFLKIALKWGKLYEEKYDAAFVMPTEKTLHNFKHAMYGKVLKQAGISPDEFVECLFAHTPHFNHAFGLNSRPDMGQVVLHIIPLVAQFEEVKKNEAKKAETAAQIAKHKAEVAMQPPKVQHVHVKATPEEIAAIEAEIQAEYAAKQPAVLLEPEPVTLEAHPVVTSSATASLTTGSPLPAVVPATLPAKKPAPQKPKPLPTLDELKKHKLEREAAAKLAAEAERKRMADATFSGSWLT